MLARSLSGALQGVDAVPVQIEVNTGQVGELRVVIVGLPDAAVKESQDRVFSALSNSGFSLPTTRTTINLAPGSIRKEGPLYDLPIALTLLGASNQMDKRSLQDYVIAGELALTGQTRAINGALALAILARKEKRKGILLPRESAEEAALVEDIPVYAVDSLSQAVQFLSGRISLNPLKAAQSPYRQAPDPAHTLDFCDVKGQAGLRRAVEIAVSGGHNILIIGPPGSGKSMVAKRIPSIMPEPTLEEFLEVLSVYSAAGMSFQQRCFQRPFRDPHHTISDVGLLGGGNPPKPGDLSLAHHGVLFMDEFPEYRRATLEVLRQPLEEGSVAISRSAGRVRFPCSVILVAAMNPCPCGYLSDPKRECRCSANQIQNYRARLSGPLLDRIDIHVEAPALTLKELQAKQASEGSAPIRERIKAVRAIQYTRNQSCNANMTHRQIREHCRLSETYERFLRDAMESLHLSARAYDRILKVSRTLADMAQSAEIQEDHLLEAIQYRALDRTLLY